MASREHWSDDGKVHVKVSTIHTNIVGSLIEWGAEALRERKRKIPAVWWNPFTWGRYEWRREGSPPAFLNVRFIRGDGTDISHTTLNPAASEQPGYHKISTMYFFASYGTGSGASDLGNDARAVANVKVTYEWEGDHKTLSHS